MTIFNAFLSASCRIMPHVQWGFFTGWTVHTGWTAMGTASQQWRAARAATCAPPWRGCPCAHWEQKAACIPLPVYPCPDREGEEHTGSSRGIWKTLLQDCTHAQDCTALLFSHQSCHPKQPCHPKQRRLILLAAAHASLGTCVRTHTRSHARTQLAFSNMPDIAFLMLAQEIPVAAWLASFLIWGAGGQAPAPARGGWTGQTHRSWPLRLLSSPIICHFRPLLLSYLGCIIFVIAKQCQKPG